MALLQKDFNNAKAECRFHVMQVNWEAKDANFYVNVTYTASVASKRTVDEVGVEPSEAGSKAIMSSSTRRRRSARTIAQRRKMLLHNRKDDIPECTSLEEIDFDETKLEMTDPDSDGKCKSAEATTATAKTATTDPLKSSNSETKVSLPGESPETAPQTTPSTDYQSAATTVTSSAFNSTLNTRGTHKTLKKRRRRRRKPNAIVKFISHLFENIGLAVTEFILFAMKNMRDSEMNTFHKPTAGLMILVGLYFTVMYLEVSFAGILHIGMEFAWPVMHVGLRMFERFFAAIAGFFSNLDDVGESVYCDVATIWCDYFHLMCENRCSYTKFALERLRR
uniref:Uncharacterized protein n=1 Tax=Panagrolaimus sp. JU765 TaxID=591449 RepID=A0AC34R464_9BILA